MSVLTLPYGGSSRLGAYSGTDVILRVGEIPEDHQFAAEGEIPSSVGICMDGHYCLR